MEITIVGPGCKNCRTLEQRTREAADALGVDVEVTEVTDVAEIAAMGVLATPALVVDGELVVSGSVPSVTRLRELLDPATPP